MPVKKLASKLKKANSSTRANQEPNVVEHDFYHNIRDFPDIKKAVEFVHDYALNEAYAKYGAEIEANTVRIEELNREIAPLEEELEQLEEKRRKTPSTISNLQVGQDSGNIPFREWAGRHKLLFCFFSLLTASAMIVGATNSSIVLLASGEPVFLEAPYRAWLLGLLVPIAGASLKLPTTFIEFEATRKRYALIVVVCAAASLGMWAVLYAFEYKGLTGSIDLGSLLEPDNKSSYLVFFQLLAEVFASAAFALSVEHIHRIYSPDRFSVNEEYALLGSLIKPVSEELAPLKAEKGERHARNIVLEKDMENYCAEKVAAYHADISRRRNRQLPQ